MTSRPLWRVVCAFACLVISGIGVASTDDPAIAAATIFVNSTSGNDSTGTGSVAAPYRTFHKAYSVASDGDTISLSGTFTWTDTDETGDVAGSGYVLSKNLTIVGQSFASTYVQAAATRGSADRSVFYVAAGRAVTIRDLTIRHGRVTGEKLGGGVSLAGAYCGSGTCPSITGTATLERVSVTANDAIAATNVMYRAGGIYMGEASTLTLRNSSVTSNSCSCYLYSAGAIAGGAQSQNLTISGSTIANNTATSTSGSTWAFDYSAVAGAIALQRFGTFLVSNSTIYGNSTNHYGGALVLNYLTRPTLTNVTIVGNSASLGAGGILWQTSWSGDYLKLFMKNVLLANNTGVGGAASDFYSKNDGYSTTHVSPSFSIIESSTNITMSGTGVVTGDQASLDLDSGLADNGVTGGVQTLAIGASSIAVNAGDSAAHGSTNSTVTPPTVDQRGYARAGAIDIGAFEYGSAGDASAPTLSSSSPADGATGIAVGDDIVLSFSEPVLAVAGKNVSLYRSDGTLIESIDAGGAQTTVLGSMVIVDPSTNLAEATGYYVMVDAGAFRDGSSNAYAGINNSTTLNFTTIDLTAPTLSSSSPVDDSNGLGAGSNIVLTFSESVVAVSGKNVVLKRSSDDSVVETMAVTTSARVTVSGATVTVNPTSNLAYSTGYYLLIDAGAFRDSAGNTYSGISSSTALNFGTEADTYAPTLSSSTPSDNAASIALSANIVLNFNEDVSAVAGKTITIKKTSDNSTVESIPADDARVTIGGSTVTVNPTGDFAYSTGYYLLVDAGSFRDSSANSFAGISASTTLNFTTLADVVAPTLTSSSPSDNATGVTLSSNIILTFSETVTAVAAKNITIKRTADNSTFETIPANDARVTVSGSTATINPSGTFTDSTSYYVMIDSGAFKDTANNSFAGISATTVLNFTTVDLTAPTWTSSTPNDNATGVPSTANIVLTFSESVVAIAGKYIVIKTAADDGVFESIPANDSRVSVSGSTVTINPTATFGNLVGYYVLVESGAFTDSAGNAHGGITVPTALNFVAEVDVTAPTLVSSTPADNATAVSAGSNIVLTFSEDVLAVTGKNIVIKETVGDTVVETIPVTDARVTISGSIVTINPTNDLGYATAFHVLVDSGAFRDISANNFAGIALATTLNFQIEVDTYAPTLTSTNPSDNAVGVATTANIVLTFSESVTAVSGKNIVIKLSSNSSTFESIPVNDARVTVSGRTVTINPSGTFAYSTGYYLSIDAGAFVDSVGLVFGGVSSASTFDFTSAAVPGPTTIYSNSSTGDDSSGDGTAASPFRTFHKAYSTASGGDTINLTGTFSWSDAGETGDAAGTGYTLAKNVTIVGQSNATTFVQAATSRGIADRMVFNIAANTTATLKYLTVRYGRVTGEYQGGGITLAGQYCGSYPCASITGTAVLQEVIVTQNDAASSGSVMHRAGGIYMREASTLTLTDSAVTSNTCTCHLYAAGGIAGGEQSQKLTISGSTIANNTATSTSGSTYAYSYASVAGGLALQRFGQLTMSNSTLYGNSTNNYGGAMSLYYQTRPTLTNVTIAGNSASLGAGGILWQTAWSGEYLKLFMKNVLIANNTGLSGSASDFHSATDGYSTTHVTATNSIIENIANITLTGAGVVTGEQGSLDLAAGLADNGATWGVQTLGIGDNSIAINAGSATAHGQSGYTVTPPSSDQRRASRVGVIDIGAFENGGGVAPTTSTTTSTTTPTSTAAPATTSPASSSTTTVAPQAGSGRLVWYVNSARGDDTTGNGSASLPYATFRKAYVAARAGDIIDLTGTYTWTDIDENGDVAGAGYRIAKNLTIRGQGAGETFVQAAARQNVADRAVFTVSAVVTIRDLTIRNGKVSGTQQGGGITNTGQLTLIGVTIENNVAAVANRSTYYNAGGLFSGSNSSVSIDKSTIRDNVCACALYGAGGIWTLQSVTKSISNSTINNNSASSSWGATYPYNYASVAGGFGTFRFGSTVITNSTFFGNATDNYAGAMVIYYQDYANLTNLTVVSNEATRGAGGILYQSEWDGFNLNIKNTILANNRGIGPNDFYAVNSASAARMSESHNIVEVSSTRQFNGIGDIGGQRDDLDIAAVLAPNGSRVGVDTIAIGADSIAKDAGSATPNGSRSPVTPPSTDQRGFARVGPVDIGAFENQTDSVLDIAGNLAASSTSTTVARTATSTTEAGSGGAAIRPTTTVRSSTSDGGPTSSSRARNVGASTTAAENGSEPSTTDVTINPNIVATTVVNAPAIETEGVESLPFQPENDTEVLASNGSVEIVMSIVDKSFAEVVQGRTGSLIAKKGLYARVRAKGFMAGTLAEVWMFSSPRLLAHLQVSGQGEAAGFVLIPEDAEIGDHRIELRGRSKARTTIKANIPLKVLADDIVTATVPPNAEDIATAVSLPTAIPAIIVDAPVANQITIGESQIRSVIKDVLGNIDISKVKLRVRINKGPWSLVDTSAGAIPSIPLSVDAGTNSVEFEITPEGGEPIVVLREVLVEGTPEAAAYKAALDSSTDNRVSLLKWLVAALGGLALVALIGAALGRRRRDDSEMVSQPTR